LGLAKFAWQQSGSLEHEEIILFVFLMVADKEDRSCLCAFVPLVLKYVIPKTITMRGTIQPRLALLFATLLLVQGFANAGASGGRVWEYTECRDQSRIPFSFAMDFTESEFASKPKGTAIAISINAIYASCSTNCYSSICSCTYHICPHANRTQFVLRIYEKQSNTSTYYDFSIPEGDRLTGGNYTLYIRANSVDVRRAGQIASVGQGGKIGIFDIVLYYVMGMSAQMAALAFQEVAKTPAEACIVSLLLLLIIAALFFFVIKPHAKRKAKS
jgi:hypothetical protein